MASRVQGARPFQGPRNNRESFETKNFRDGTRCAAFQEFLSDSNRRVTELLENLYDDTVAGAKFFYNPPPGETAVAARSSRDSNCFELEILL